VLLALAWPLPPRYPHKYIETNLNIYNRLFLFLFYLSISCTYTLLQEPVPFLCFVCLFFVFFLFVFSFFLYG
jgi:hypothetical protein